MRPKALLPAVLLALTAARVSAQTIEDSVMMRKNSLCTAVLYSHDRWESYWEGPLKRVNGNIGKITTQSVAGMVDYGVTDRLNVIASLPYVWTEASQGVLHGVSGWQDLTVAAKFNLLETDFTRSGSLRTIVAVSAGLPIGDYTPDYYPLSLGSAARTRPAMVDEHLARADLILGVGTSFTRSLYITPLPASAELGQIVNDRRDVATGYDVAFACVGDARLVLAQLLAELRGGAAPERQSPAAGLADSRAAFAERWRPGLTSDAAPLSPYRLVHELMQVVDRSRTVVTHDAGHPRDQIVPFYEAVVPRGYLGWGKSTQLGTGFGLTLGAKLAKPDWLAVNIMGDAAFGMIGMDFETAVRARIPILTIVMNNGIMGGYGKWMPAAVDRFQSSSMGGDYAAIARALGGHAEHAGEPAELRPALERAIASTADGNATLLEVMTHEEPDQPEGS